MRLSVGWAIRRRWWLWDKGYGKINVVVSIGQGGIVKVWLFGLLPCRERTYSVVLPQPPTGKHVRALESGHEFTSCCRWLGGSQDSSSSRKFSYPVFGHPVRNAIGKLLSIAWLSQIEQSRVIQFLPLSEPWFGGRNLKENLLLFCGFLQSLWHLLYAGLGSCRK